MYKRLFVFLSVLALAGCASSPQPPEEDVIDAEINAEFSEHPNDPFEGFNRTMWALNYDYLDPYIAKPVSLAYVDYTPSFLRTGIRNFIRNLEEPFNVVNNLLTLDGSAALNHFNRFWINSTFGIAGILDVAGLAGVPQENDRQFGDVLGSYGVGQGPYLMLPIYGPLTLRETVGDTVDVLYPPLSLLTLPQTALKWLFNGMEERAALVQQEELLRQSPDPYVFARDAYLQNKAFEARGGEQEIPVLDDAYLNDELLDEADDY